VTPDPRFWSPNGNYLGFSDGELLGFLRETSRLETTPGLPWVGLGCATVKDVLVQYPGQLCAAVRERMQARLSISLSDARALDSEDVVVRGLRDVVRVFIKQEPHTLKKLSAGRYRPIMNSSLTDIACDRIVLERLANAEVDQWDKIPSKPGMGLDDRSVVKLRAGVPPGVLSSDAKAFDFHVSEWSMDGSASVEILQYGVSESSDLAHLIRMSVVVTCRKVWALATGHLFAQIEPGIQETGSRMTACRNSKIRVLLAHIAGALWCAAMGDDALETWPGGVFDPQGNYARLGHEVVVPSLPPGVEYEFCSTHFYCGAGPAVPQGWAKTFYRLLGHAPDQTLLRGFEYELRAHPLLGELLEFARVKWLKA